MALRWINERNPEFRDQIAAILGKDYTLFFDEKENGALYPNDAFRKKKWERFGLFF